VAQYEFKAPDGKTYLFKGPSGLTQSDVDLFGKNYFGVEEPQVMPAAPVKKPETGFIPSVKRGYAGLESLATDVLPAMVGKAFGADEYAAQQMQEAAKKQEETAKKYPAEVPSYTDIKGIGDALTYAKEAIGEALPTLIPSLFTGGAASIAGRGAVAAAQSAAEKAVLAQAAKGLAGEELKQAATQAGIQAARQTALKYEAGGALAGSAAQNVPDVYQNIYEATGKQDLGTAIAFGSFNAVLDAVTPVALLRKAKLSGIGPEELGAAWYKRAGKGVAQGFVTEGGTEALQEASSAAAESFVDQNRQFFTPQNFERFINAGLKGGLGGAGITGATDVVFGKGPEAGTQDVIKTKGLADVEVPTDVDVAPQVAPTLAARNVSGFEISPEGEPVVAPTGAPATEVDLLVEKFNKQAAEIKELEQKKQDGTFSEQDKWRLSGKRNSQRRLKTQIESLQATQKGTQDVGPTDTTAGGTSVPVVEQPSAVVPAEGLGKVDGLGVVPARQDVVKPVAREGEQQAPVEDTQKQIDELSAILQNPTLDERDREALEERLYELTNEETPVEEAPVEEEIPSGPETPETVETETQGQEEPAAEPAREIAFQEKEMYDETRDYHNGIEPDERLHLPEFNALAPEERQVYFDALTDNSQVSHDVAAERLSGYLAEKQGIQPEGVPQTKPLPKFVEEQLDKNNGNAFLNYLRTSAQDPVHRAIAQALYKLKLNTKVEIVQGLPNNRPAEYDPKTDTIRMTKEGQTETVLLHEFAHAGTIRVLNSFEESTGKLSQKQEDGAVHLDYLMGKTQPLLAQKYPAAYKNVYEFVSYAITDRAFQKELQRIQIPAKDSLWGQVKDAWSNFVKGVAQLLGIPDTIEARNALIETFGAFEYVMSAPKGGIEMKPLPTETKQAEGYDESKMTDQELADKAESEVQLKEQGGKAFFRNLFTKKGGHWLATVFQNERYPLKVVEDRAKLFGLLQRIGPDLNNVYGQITRSAGVAVDLYDQYMRTATEDTHAAVEAYAKKAGLSIRDALERLHIILEAKHEPERRFVKYLKTVPLEKDSKRIKFNGEQYSADGFREAVMRELSKPFYEIKPEMTQDEIATLEQQRKEYALDLRAALEKVVADQSFWAKQVNGKATTPQMFDVNSELYNVIAQRTPRQIAAILKSKVTPETEAEIEAVSKALKRVTETSIQLNKMANYHSQPTSNVIDFYNFQNYVPFKGKEGFKQIDDEFNIDSRRIGGDLQEGQNPFTGRLTESENPLLQALADGAGAAMRAGRKDLTLAIMNAVNDKLLIGKVIKNAANFEDRFLGDLSKKDIGGENKIFHYNNDGTIDVIELNEPQQREAIRRSYRTTQPLIDTMNMITSGIGQTHTRYNPAFAPMNFVRDALTNAFTLGAELGPVKAGQLLTAVASDVAGGGMYKSIKFSSLYSKGQFDKIRELAAKDQYYADLLEYIQLGGKVSYLQGLAAKGALDGLMKEIGRSGVLKTKDQIDKFIDIYNDMFELSSRAATYRMLKDQFYAENKKSGKFKKDADALEDAKIQAVEYAKNLANFEQVGRWGKEAGALFMFFRPAATGAVRAIEALAPAFGFDEASFREEAAAQGRTPEQIDNAVKELKQRQLNARYMATSLLGAGVAMYMMALMMAGEDDEGRNKVVTDDMARWTRNARFHIPGTDIIIQIPWGFGLGAFAAAGAQIASIAAGKTSLADAFSNVTTIGLDSFIPLPISRISPIDNFPAFAMDSVTPSAFRPFFEYVMNLDGLGREIYNNRQSRFGDAYTGGDNIPEIYKKVARELFDATDGAWDWSPNTMYFFASNYFDGMAKMASSATNMGLTVAGQKEFDLKNDVAFISSFIGSKSNIDAREFSSVEKKVQALEKRINALKDRPEQLDRFMDANPDAYAAVQFYNSQVNGSLRQIRTAANQVRASKELSIKERKEQLKELTTMSNQVKHQLVLVFEDFGITP